MQSIKTKIITSFLAVILTMVGIMAVVVYINNSLTNRYQQINSNIIYEQDLKNSIWAMVEACYNDFKTGDFTSYENELTKIKEIEKILDEKTKSNKDTYAAYLGVKNSLNIVIEDVSAAKKDWEKSHGTAGSSTFFENAGSKFEFVKQNTTDLILAETQNIATVSQEIQKTQKFLTLVMGGITLFAALASVVYALFFAKKITDPLIVLSTTAKNISDGDLSLNVEEKILNIKDEIGSLANSFQAMIVSLKNKLMQIQETQAKMKLSNVELEKMNQLMVGRELKMIELKKQITDLKKF